MNADRPTSFGGCCHLEKEKKIPRKRPFYPPKILPWFPPATRFSRPVTATAQSQSPLVLGPSLLSEALSMNTGHIHSQLEAVCSREEAQEECVHTPPERAEKDEEDVAAESEGRAG